MLISIIFCENNYIKVLFMKKCSNKRGKRNVYHKITVLKTKRTISYMLKSWRLVWNFPIIPNVLELWIEQFTIRKMVKIRFVHNGPLHRCAMAKLRGKIFFIWGGGIVLFKLSITVFFLLFVFVCFLCDLYFTSKLLVIKQTVKIIKSKKENLLELFCVPYIIF